jgi:GH24 family phage-related lysozyme (muramidase)
MAVFKGVTAQSLVRRLLADSRPGRARQLLEVDLPPPAEHRQASAFSPAFIQFVKGLEARSAKTHQVVPSSEGGAKTLGYGHKLRSGEEPGAIDDRQAEQQLLRDLEAARQGVYRYIQRAYGVRVQLSQKQEEMLTEFAFNLGGLEKFPKFADAVLRQDWARATQEFRRFYRTPDGQRRELQLRNRLFAQRYGLA